MNYKHALIVGAGSGLSASLARLFAKNGLKVALAARSPQKLAEFAAATGAATHNCDAAKRDEVEALFAKLDAAKETPDVVIYNPSYRVRGPVTDLDPVEVEKSLAITAFGAFSARFTISGASGLRSAMNSISARTPRTAEAACGSPRGRCMSIRP